MKIGIYLLAALLVVGLASATVETKNTFCKDNGFDYGMAKYTCNQGYALVESDLTYETTLVGTCDMADWTAKPAAGVVVYNGVESKTVEEGDVSGTVSSWDVNTIKEVYFCGFNTGGGAEVSSFTVSDNGVPEFSTLTLGIAVLTATMGLVYLRKQ